MRFSCDSIVKAAAFGLLQYCAGVDQERFLQECRNVAVAEAIIETLPIGLRSVVEQRMHTPHSALRESVSRAMQHGDNAGYLHFTVKWYAGASADQRVVCWPMRPDFEFNDFMGGLGTLAALLVHPKSLTDDIPKRFMDLPPGYLNRSKIHLISRDALDFPKLRHAALDFRWPAVIGYSYPSLSEMRSMLDKWSGRAGRAMLALMRSSYTCTYNQGCSKRADENLPYLPTDYTAAIDQVVRRIQSSKSFAICLGNVTTIPNTAWFNA